MFEALKNSTSQNIKKKTPKKPTIADIVEIILLLSPHPLKKSIHDLRRRTVMYLLFKLCSK